MSIDPKANEFGTVEVYLDNQFSAFPALSNSHILRGSLAALLAMEVTSRPIADVKPLTRDAILAINKAQAEATPAQRQILLGWLIDA